MDLNADSLNVLRPILPIPLWQKVAGLVLVLVLLFVGYVFMFWTPVTEAIASQESKVKTERILLQKNQKLAADLPKKEKEFAELEKQLRFALSFLPKQSQIPDLLENVSWAGKDSGLEFAKFQPLAEQPQEFWAEVPVDINISGDFGQLLTFLKRVGEMPRIVSVKGLQLSQKGKELSVTGKAVTYRFLEKSDKKIKKKKKRSKRK